MNEKPDSGKKDKPCKHGLYVPCISCFREAIAASEAKIKELEKEHNLILRNHLQLAESEIQKKALMEESDRLEDKLNKRLAERETAIKYLENNVIIPLQKRIIELEKENEKLKRMYENCKRLIRKEML